MFKKICSTIFIIAFVVSTYTFVFAAGCYVEENCAGGDASCGCTGSGTCDSWESPRGYEVECDCDDGDSTSDFCTHHQH